MNTPKFTAETSCTTRTCITRLQPIQLVLAAELFNPPHLSPAQLIRIGRCRFFLFSLLNTTLGRFFVKPPGALLVISGVIQCSAFGIRSQPPARGPSNPFTPFRLALRWSTRF